MVIIEIILVVLVYPILHTMFQLYQSISSGEDGFFRSLYMGVAAMLVK